MTGPARWAIETLGCEISLSDIYDRVDFPAGEQDSPASFSRDDR